MSSLVIIVLALLFVAVVCLVIGHILRHTESYKWIGWIVTITSWALFAYVGYLISWMLSTYFGITLTLNIGG